MSSGNDYLVLEEKAPKHSSSLDAMDDKYLYALDEVAVVPQSGIYTNLKSLFERMFALVLLVLLSPVILFFGFMVRFSSKGPAFYLQQRLGLNGQTYTMVKLRTMVHDAESGTGAVWASASDPRVTRLGSFLRKTQIDEFPQLWNVLMGNMSLIGPRPERPEIAKRLELDIPHYMQRLHVKPGITGLAQLTLPADTDLESVRRKLIPDLYYVKNMSLILDVKIFAHTGIYFMKSILRCVHQVFSLPTLNTARISLTSEFEDGFEEVEAKAS